MGNSIYKDLNIKLCEEFHDDHKNGRLLFWESPNELKFIDDNEENRSLASLSRAYLIQQIDPDVVYIPNMFEGNVDDVLMDIKYKNKNILYVSVLHDLIPLLNPQMYLSDPRNKQFYLNQLEEFEKSDFLVAISESAQKEQKELSKNIPSIYTFNGISEELFNLKDINYSKDHLLKEYKITQDFFLYVGGGDPRKNLVSYVKAFGKLELEYQERFELVFAGSFSEGERLIIEDAVRNHCSDKIKLTFTGKVSDLDLAILYKETYLFVFPSIHEGFGLPPLEALFFNAPVIGSNTTSIPEIIQKPDALFDPMNIEQIHDLIKLSIEDFDFRESLRQKDRDLSIFSYDVSANKLFKEFQKRIKVKTILDPKDDIVLRFLQDKKNKTNQRIRENIFQIIDANEKTLIRSSIDRKSIQFRIEGPFDSSYSLALVNRETAKAIKKIGFKVSLFSTEGPGDFDPSEDFLEHNQDVAEMYFSSKEDRLNQCLVSRLLYPPRVADNIGRGRYLHHYAWEETGFPHDWVADFNENLDGMSLLSSHVKKIMIDNGVHTPMKVSGCGVDHWKEIDEEEFEIKSCKKFKFIHVSSCFDRKGPEKLIQGYFGAFTENDDVTLIIKTFPNPHNKITEIIKDHQSKRSDPPEIILINEDLRDSQLKGLLIKCDAYVSTTFAEGFGLPFAEAFYSNLPVIATNWSGHLDFLNKNNSYLVDYDFKYAKSHFELFHSVWAEPKLDDLIKAFKDLYRSSTSKRNDMAKNGREILENYFSWEKVASRYISAVRDSNQQNQEAKIAIISTYNTKCGIATYCEELFGKQFKSRNLKIFAAYEDNVISDKVEDFTQRTWTKGFRENLGQFDETMEKIIENKINVVIIQFQHTWYDYDELETFLKKLHEHSIKIIIELHNTSDPENNDDNFEYISIKNFRRIGVHANRVLVHSAKDLNNLKELKLIENVSIMPHGVKVQNFDEFYDLRKDKITISTFGFCLPQKGILELVEAIFILKQKNIDVFLNIYSAIFPDPVSENYKKEIDAKIKELDLSKYIIFDHSFKGMKEIKTNLSKADIIVYPYHDNNESVSGAVRVGLSIGKPVLVSDISMFEEFGNSVLRSRSNNPQDISDSITNFLEENPSKAKMKQLGNDLTKNFLAQSDFKIISRRYLNLAQSLINNE